MNYFIYLLQVCNICILFHCVTAYVLFAANLDDFKSIAKKFIPAKLADQLADMASPSSIKYLNKAVDNEENSDKFESSENVEEDLVVKDKEKLNTKSKKRFSVESPSKDINIDEIVEKVRIKLEKEYKNFQNSPTDKKTIEALPSLKYKQKPMKNVNKEIIYDNVSNGNEYEQERNDEEIIPEEVIVTERQNFNINEPQDEEEVPPSMETVVEKPETTEIEDLFQEIDMKKSNDSYEDYVTPKRDEIFEGGDTEHSKITVTKKHSYSPQNKQKVIRYVDKIKWKAKEKVTTPTYDYNEEIKAKTESLVYDERETVYVNQSTDGIKSISLEAVEINRPIDVSVHKIKKAIGTMIPTREVYKMSSPNYYAKLPIVAEKYNFDEPIPEKDREPENLKYFGNPPASINRKVKL